MNPKTKAEAIILAHIAQMPAGTKYDLAYLERLTGIPEKLIFRIIAKHNLAKAAS